MPIVTRTVGTCPICVGQFKVRGERLVHHGYQRPGWGHIIGNCFGVGWKPYELSADVCVAWQKRLRGMIRDTEEFISSLEAREPETLSETVKVYGGRYKETKTFVFHRDSAAPSPKQLYAGEPRDKTENYEYERVRDNQIRHARGKLPAMREDLARMQRLIDEWQPAPLLEIDEEGFTPEVRRERDERRAKKEAERAERERERAARRAKTEQRERVKEEQFYEFKRQLAVLASWPKSANRDLQARRLNGAMRRFYKGSSIVWQLDFGSREEHAEIERNLITLGLAGRYDNGAFQHYLHIDARGKPEID